MSDDNFSTIWVYLVETENERGRPYSKYELLISDISGERPDRLIEIADLSKMGGGLHLSQWEINWKDDKPIISLYFVMSSMGHDLDQWAHYDWETGERIKGFKSSRELSENR